VSFQGSWCRRCRDRCSDFARLVAAAEDDGGVGLLVVVVFDLDFDAAVVGEIGAVEAVGGVGRILARDEPLGMFDDPGRVDAHVVGHHVAGEADAVVIGAVAQIDVGRSPPRSSAMV
jgi:hypothetical protein